ARLDDALDQQRMKLQRERGELDRRLAALDIRVETSDRTGDHAVFMRSVAPVLVACIRAQLAPGEDLGPIFEELESR
ncbi:MAG: hypothetical protein GY946_21030, partial [bacterium]|nr:hypothetical protein [bacterium]